MSSLSAGRATAKTRPASPIERYRADLERDDFQYDAAQELAVKHLQRLYDELVAAPTAAPKALVAHKGLKAKMAGLMGKKVSSSDEPVLPSVKGLYFWGGVGRGKTYLVDTFYEALPFPDKMRTHFHRFMQRVHNELTHYKGEKNPLNLIAGKFATEARVICFDEFLSKILPMR
ncbi:hypothetical protein HORIV_26310 [Vreelandella olivaria]|uniref:Cell division protein ZapE n=1 Tax=Vreelandella olivaria TaxID=390919 RepID=A0ABN5WZ96_9GAMM|nr:hypothetical protein HORIV_26310 [Halomonas olivaria]